MRVVVQRVLNASVEILEEDRTLSIEKGSALFIGIGCDDTIKDVDWLARKVAHLRIFEDERGRPHYSSIDLNYPLLVVSQFTLYGNTHGGARPEFLKAARAAHAEPLYQRFIELLIERYHLDVKTGSFGKEMRVHLTNDGPFTLWIDSQNKT